jgi:hypothetical protein
MGAVADFVGDVVGGVVEAVGDVVETVGDVVSDAVDWIGDNVVQPILDDPITFVASAVAYAYGIPGLSFAGPGTAASVGVATTGSRLAQGDDFDDAVKAGAFATAGTAIGNVVETGFTSGGKDFSPNIYSSADDIAAANAAKNVVSGSTIGGDDLAGASMASADDLVRQLDEAAELPRDLYPDFEPLASTGDDQLVRKATTDPYTSQADAFGARPDDVVPDDAFSRAAKRGYAQTDPVQYQPDAFNEPPGGYKPPVFDASDAISPKKEPIVVGPQPGDPGWVPPIDDRGTNWGRDVIRTGPDVEKSLLDSVIDLGKAGVETVGDWIWDGAKWVFKNPEYLAGGLLLADTLLNRDDGTGTTDDTKIDDTDKEERDEDFGKDLEELVLDRERTTANFGRSTNPYDSPLYKYAESGKGEHEFYTPTVYTPAEEYDASEKVNAARGGSIGALNNQLPSYYRYGAMPMAHGGYASGGLRSLKHDGRSDHIPAMLSDGEFVVDAETVALLGNGSNQAGANRLEQMRQDVRKQKGRALSKGQFSSNAKSPLAYIKQKRG